METFTPISALVGGIMIGAAAGLLLFANGRIAGVSGILAGLLPPQAGEAAWRGLFLVGLVLGALAYRAVGDSALVPRFDVSALAVVAGGLLVGFGTRVGGGCTSGHGVCGVARLSVRSLVATAIFMAAGALAVFAVRHVFG